MYLVEFFKNLFKRSNVGAVIYLLLNTFIIVYVFSDGFTDGRGILVGLMLYVVSLGIALSPVGEWILRITMGCKAIKGTVHEERLWPLFREVLEKARESNPSIPEDVGLFINNNEPSRNAFATGRKTVCITRGALSFDDDQIKGIFAHELAHLANKDTDLFLLITISNFIVTAIFIAVRIFISLFSFVAAGMTQRHGIMLTFNLIANLVLAGLMYLWTKLGILLVYHSSRQTEYNADKYAYSIGYGQGLLRSLESLSETAEESKGIWATLVSTHPDINKRIAKLKELLSKTAGDVS